MLSDYKRAGFVIRRIASISAVLSAMFISIGSLLPPSDFAGLITIIGALLPLPDLPFNLPGDKLLHSFSYLITITLATIGSGVGWRSIIWGIALLFLGGAIELLQTFVPGRESSIGDLLANIVGVTLGYVFGCLLSRTLGD